MGVDQEQKKARMHSEAIDKQLIEMSKEEEHIVKILLLGKSTPGLVFLRGQGRFHFLKGTSIGNIWMGTKAKIRGYRGSVASNLFQASKSSSMGHIFACVRALSITSGGIFIQTQNSF